MAKIHWTVKCFVCFFLLFGNLISLKLFVIVHFNVDSPQKNTFWGKNYICNSFSLHNFFLFVLEHCIKVSNRPVCPPPVPTNVYIIYFLKWLWYLNLKGCCSKPIKLNFKEHFNKLPKGSLKKHERVYFGSHIINTFVCFLF